MPRPRHQLTQLYRATFLFGVGCGVSLALTPLFLDASGFDKQSIGTLALFFAFGLVLFAVPTGALLGRFGGKRVLAACLIGYAASVTLFPFMTGYTSIALIRFLDGMFSIGIWVSSETILLSRSTREDKGHLTSLYAVWLASGYVVGPALARGLSELLDLKEIFSVAGGVALIAAGYVWWRLPERAGEEEEFSSGAGATRSAARPVDVTSIAEVVTSHPEPVDKTKDEVRPITQILWDIKTACFAVFSYGYFQSSVVLFLPLYLIESKGIQREQTIVVPGFFCLGMLLFTNLAGRWGDRLGHLRMVTLLSGLGALATVGFVYVDAFWMMCVLVFSAGATLASMSPVALALTGVIVNQEELGRANSLYNTLYASGILLGPPLTSQIFSHYGGAAMLYHLGGLWTALVLFCMVYSRDDPAVRRLLTVTPSAVD